MEITKEDTLGEITSRDYRAAGVFEKYGLDYCCNGNRSLGDACSEAGLDTDEVLRSVKESEHSSAPATDYNAWPLDLLADYVEKKHHRYVEEQIPVLRAHLEKISRVHGDRHPELFEVRNLFEQTAGELTMHMKKEELMIFPFIRKMVRQKHSGLPGRPRSAFDTVQNPIQTMMHDHDEEGERFRKISSLTNGYTAPDDACNSYRITFTTLKAFEEDLHTHIHLENNILFPKSVALEQQFTMDIA